MSKIRKFCYLSGFFIGFASVIMASHQVSHAESLFLISIGLILFGSAFLVCEALSW